MYIPSHFAISSPDQLHRIIREHPLGALVTMGPEGLDANHIPFELAVDQGDRGVLTAHVARANPVWRRMCWTPCAPRVWQRSSWYWR